jgi:ABC-type Fe3+/spermidine/putrescine transport system ATPase subunit
MSDRVAILNSGNIIDVGTIREIYERPKNRFVAEFLGETNIIECIVDSVEDNVFTAFCGDLKIEGEASRKLEKGEKIQVMIRPEKIKIIHHPPPANKNTASGKIVEIIYKGAYSDLKIEVDDSKIFTVKTFEPIYQVGEKVFIKWDSRDVTVISG